MKDWGFGRWLQTHPFNVEDQTDEDFFDKLVEDDMEPFKSGQDEGNDSDDAKAFANLGVNDVDASIENPNGGESVNEDEGEKSRIQQDTGLVVHMKGMEIRCCPYQLGMVAGWNPVTMGRDQKRCRLQLEARAMNLLVLG